MGVQVHTYLTLTCGSVFSRKETKSGYVTWACRTHNYQAQNCSMGRIPETEIYAVFVRLYNKLKQLVHAEKHAFRADALAVPQRLREVDVFPHYRIPIFWPFWPFLWEGIDKG